MLQTISGSLYPAMGYAEMRCNLLNHCRRHRLDRGGMMEKIKILMSTKFKNITGTTVVLQINRKNANLKWLRMVFDDALIRAQKEVPKPSERELINNMKIVWRKGLPKSKQTKRVNIW